MVREEEAIGLERDEKKESWIGTIYKPDEACELIGVDRSNGHNCVKARRQPQPRGLRCDQCGDCKNTPKSHAHACRKPLR